MRQLRFSKDFRSRLSDKLMDLGNVTAGALVLGQFVSGLVARKETYGIGWMVSYRNRSACCYWRIHREKI
ncbi:hypothetical protein HY086_04235 [Candidatus Gottesmanbacteria bacterium]|nr:hypothetical protein [Candidatus Gottesmanbacteria bacterium]